MNFVEPDPRLLSAGELSAVFWPGLGMLGASLRHRGAEILRKVDRLRQQSATGSTAGIPLLHPWANRLCRQRYCAAERTVELDRSSPYLRFDCNGLPIHGVPWSMLGWKVIQATPTTLASRLEWQQPDLLRIFPFGHRLDMRVTLAPDGVTIQTILTASPDNCVPISFGFHPYVGIPDLPRDLWRLSVPTLQKLILDSSGIPTGAREQFPGLDACLGGLQFDDGLVVGSQPVSLSISGAGRRVSIDLLAGYRYAQIYAPMGEDYIALEPMTAPTNALVSHRDLQVIPPGSRFIATFRIRVESHP